MANILGFTLPDINITGFLSSTWIYIFIIGFIGLILIVGIGLLLFFMTYKRKIIVLENTGLGYRPVIRTRARVIKLGVGGEEILKTLAGGVYVSAYGQKMGKNTYWFAKGSDGYWYNCVLGDFDAKLGMLDIEPIDRDVRMFHVALDRMSHLTWGKQSFMEKYGIHMLLFVFLLTLIFGMWLIIGQVGDATEALAETAKTNEKVVADLGNILIGSSNIKSGSGLVPAG